MQRLTKQSMRQIAPSSLRRLWLKRFVLLAAGPTLSSFPSLPAWSAADASADATAPVDDVYPEVFPRPLAFPRDFGAHPEYRTEWWYMTGWLGEAADRMGFQVTFFRSRTLHPDSNPSRFAPRQLLFAHAALALPAEGQLRHAEVAGRAGPAGAVFSATDTGVELSGWSLQRTAEDHYKVLIPTDKFTLELVAIPTQAPVLRGEGGYSTKGPEARFASYYYSRPHLKVSAQVSLKNSTGTRGGVEKLLNLSGSAWFDHEWSSSLMMPGAVGWDWIGINLLDGSSLMAFRMRDAAGAAMFSEWDWRDAQGQVIEKRQDVNWQPAGKWRSPRSLFTYPELFELRVGDRTLTLRPLMSDQEVDAQTSTGGFYYEGAVELLEKGKLLGRGYLELTGYGAPVAL